MLVETLQETLSSPVPTFTVLSGMEQEWAELNSRSPIQGCSNSSPVSISSGTTGGTRQRPSGLSELERKSRAEVVPAEQVRTKSCDLAPFDKNDFNRWIENRCLRCGLEGHKESLCRKAKLCYRCRCTGHLANSCPHLSLSITRTSHTSSSSLKTLTSSPSISSIAPTHPLLAMEDQDPIRLEEDEITTAQGEEITRCMVIQADERVTLIEVIEEMSRRIPQEPHRVAKLANNRFLIVGPTIAWREEIFRNGAIEITNSNNQRRSFHILTNAPPDLIPMITNTVRVWVRIVDIPFGWRNWHGVRQIFRFGHLLHTDVPTHLGIDHRFYRVEAMVENRNSIPLSRVYMFVNRNGQVNWVRIHFVVEEEVVRSEFHEHIKAMSRVEWTAKEEARFNRLANFTPGNSNSNAQLLAKKKKSKRKPKKKATGNRAGSPATLSPPGAAKKRKLNTPTAAQGEANIGAGISPGAVTRSQARLGSGTRYTGILIGDRRVINEPVTDTADKGKGIANDEEEQMRMAAKASRKEKRRLENEGPGQTSGAKKQGSKKTISVARANVAAPAKTTPVVKSTATAAKGTPAVKGLAQPSKATPTTANASKTNPASAPPAIKISSSTPGPSVPPAFTKDMAKPKARKLQTDNAKVNSPGKKFTTYNIGMGSKVVKAAEEGLLCTIGDIPNIIMDLAEEGAVEMDRDIDLVFQDDNQILPRDSFPDA